MSIHAAALKAIEWFNLDAETMSADSNHRSPRIKRLHRQVINLTRQRKLKVAMFSGTELRSLLIGGAKGTKQEMTELLAKQFLDELASRLPPKRKAWMSEDWRMDIFDAVGLVVTYLG